MSLFSKLFDGDVDTDTKRDEPGFAVGWYDGKGNYGAGKVVGAGTALRVRNALRNEGKHAIMQRENKRRRRGE